MTKTAILAAGFIDLTPDGVDYHRGECLLIEDGRVVGFQPVSSLTPDVTRVERGADYCLPGLVDTAFLPGIIVPEDGKRPTGYGESVLMAKRAAQRWLAAGVTSVGSMGAYDRMDVDFRDCIANGRIVGPRFYPALTPLVPAGAVNFHFLYGVREVSGADDARRAARDLIKQGAERIVVYADVPLEFHADPYETARRRLTFSVEELSELVTQAAHAGCYVHAQAISTAAIDNCLSAGLRSIGCAFGLNEAHLPIMAQKGIALAPNLALGATIRELGPGAGIGEASIGMVSRQRIAPELLLKAHEAGVDIVCGTNTAFMAGDVVRECLELHRAGLSAEACLRAATGSGAATLKPYLEFGFFRSHHFADLCFLAQDPLQDLSHLSQVAAVMREGTFQEIESGVASRMFA